VAKTPSMPLPDQLALSHTFSLLPRRFISTNAPEEGQDKPLSRQREHPLFESPSRRARTTTPVGFRRPHYSVTPHWHHCDHVRCGSHRSRYRHPPVLRLPCPPTSIPPAPRNGPRGPITGAGTDKLTIDGIKTDGSLHASPKHRSGFTSVVNRSSVPASAISLRPHQRPQPTDGRLFIVAMPPLRGEALGPPVKPSFSQPTRPTYRKKKLPRRNLIFSSIHPTFHALAVGNFVPQLFSTSLAIPEHNPCSPHHNPCSPHHDPCYPPSRLG